MCLIAFAWNPGGRQSLLVLANRDEFYERPTLAADWWEDHPDVWAGRDLTAGGTWLGITKTGRFATITNFREPGHRDPQAESRGHLVANFLTGNQSPSEYARTVAAQASRFNGFNLLVGTLAGPAPSLWYLTHSRSQPKQAPEALDGGVYGLSNAMLDTPWPKVVRLTASLATLKASEAKVPAYMQVLSDRSLADDADLPSTGIALEWERVLSAPFIISPDYGTRSQTVLQAWNDGSVDVAERSFDNEEQAIALVPSSLRQVRFDMANTERR